MSDAQQRIEEIVKGNKVVVFMKGSRVMPQCGFSARAVQVIGHYTNDFTTVNVLADPAVRQGVKEYSNWPTIPQVYVNGEFVGGSDVIWQLHEQSELAGVLGVEAPAE